MKNFKFYLGFIILSVIFQSCGTTTFITDTWEKPGFTGQKFKKIMVIAVTKDNLLARRTIEDELVRNFKVNGITAITSYNELPHGTFDADNDGKIDNNEEAKEILRKKTEELGVDGILVMRLKDLSKETKYVPGATTWAPSYYFSPYYSYYFGAYESIYSTGYLVNTTKVYIESSLFGVSKEELLYSLLSETIDPASVGDFSKTFSNALVNTLLEAKVLRK